MKKCATCYPDPATRRWHNPKKVKLGGTSESNWVCDSCANRQPNWDWVFTPASEIYGVEYEDGDDAAPDADTEPGPYETDLCIQIMKLYCTGSGYKRIASELDCDWDYVRCTVIYWKTHRGYFVEQLRAMLKNVH